MGSNLTTCTPIEEARIRELAAEEKSASEISRALAPEFIRTRNSIVGICARKGIRLLGNKGSTPGTPIPQTQAPKSDTARKNFGWTRKKPKAMQLPAPSSTRLLAKGTGLVPLLYARDGQCRMIPGDAQSLLVCGAPTVTGYSYCQNHRMVVFAPVRSGT